DIGSGEAIRVDYVNDLTGNPAASGGFAFEDHYVVNGAAVSFGNIAGSKTAAARFTAHDDPDGNDAVGDGPVHPITSVAIRFGGQIVVVALASVPDPHSVIVGGHSFTIDKQADGSVIISGLVNGATIATYTADGFNSLEVAYVSGEEFVINGFSSFSFQNVPGNFNVAVQLLDSDGDTAAAALSVTLLPANHVTSLAADDSVTVAEGGSLTSVNALANDSDPGGTLTAASITGFSQGTHGSVVKNAD